MSGLRDVLTLHRLTGATRRLTEDECTCGEWVEDFNAHVVDALAPVVERLVAARVGEVVERVHRACESEGAYDYDEVGEVWVRSRVIRAALAPAASPRDGGAE